VVICSLSRVLKHRILIVGLTLSLLAAACGGDSITATNCDELADETVAMFQRLIDEVDAEFGDTTMEEVLTSGAPLPSVEEFEEDVTTLNELTIELGCDREEVGAEVQSRAGELTAESDLGQFLIESIRAGAL
jgi:NifB/MoaA-like Fe-S oxidoreductase